MHPGLAGPPRGHPRPTILCAPEPKASEIDMQRFGAVGVLKVGEIFVHKRGSGPRGGESRPGNGVHHAIRTLPPEKQAEVDDLGRAIREAVDAEINELAASLTNTDDTHVFGDNEFRIRALAHKIAAEAIEQRLAQKKRMPFDRSVGDAIHNARATDRSGMLTGRDKLWLS